MKDRAPVRKQLDERVSDLEVTVERLTDKKDEVAALRDEVGALSERLTQATQVEEILRRARQEK